MYNFGKRSRERMEGLHPNLVEIADRALSYGIMDLTVLKDGGVRTTERQRELVAKGASKTMRSRHLRQSDGYGHALDLAPYPVDWGDTEAFTMMATLMFKAASELGYKLTWGGHWNWKDYPHFQYEGEI